MESNMKAVQIDAYGGPGNMVLREVATPEPGPGEALVRLEYAGVNYTDVYNRNGLYAKSHTYANSPPFTLGREGGGVVERVGTGVDSVAAGDRVAWCLPLGSYAEAAVVPAWRLVKIPDPVDTAPATALMLQGCTAHYLTHSLFRIEAGMRCLVHAAAGGVGQHLVALAKHRGAEVFATVGTGEKARIAASHGADHVILYRREDFAARVREATGGRGVDVVYDSVGRATIEGSMRSLARRGMLVNFGAASGAVESIEPLALAEAGSLFFTRPHMADYMRDAGEVAWRGREMFEHHAAGRVATTIDRILPLGAAAEAHRILEARETKGKILLKIE